MFPTERPRRLRRTAALRHLVAETSLTPDDLVAPLFVGEGLDEPRPISSLPGHVQHTLTSLHDEVRALRDVGVKGVILFGVPVHKDDRGTGAYDPSGIVQIALRSLRDEFGDDVVLMADLCLDEYITHGHCGVLDHHGNVDNDATLELYARAAIVQADAGAAIVAPSGMMDGQVGAIRAALDGEGFVETVVLAYAAKFASSLYGPFREAVRVEILGGGDRRGYQQDWRNRREALREARADVSEGADIVMVKPALAYLDIIYQVKQQFNLPVAAYNVSGEFSMIKAAAKLGWIDGERAMMESLIAMKRAGADIILTYFAKEAAALLNK